MPTALTCERCGVKLKVPNRLAGQLVMCPRCQQPVTPGRARSAARESPSGTPSPGSSEPPVEAVRGTPPPRPKRRSLDPVADTPCPPHPVPKLAISPAGESGDEPTASAEPSWRECPLLKHPRIIVRPRGGLSANFDLLDAENKQQLGLAEARAGVFVALLRGLAGGAVMARRRLSTRIEVRETEGGPVVFSVRWAASPLSGTVRGKVHAGDGELLGQFREKVSALLGGFWVFDASDEQLAEVKFKFGLPPRMYLETPSGREFGKVTPGGVVEAAGDRAGEKLGLTVTPLKDAAERPEIKALLLGVALAMEFAGLSKRFGQR
jgi:hypothetical protein